MPWGGPEPAHVDAISRVLHGDGARVASFERSSTSGAWKRHRGQCTAYSQAVKLDKGWGRSVVAGSVEGLEKGMSFSCWVLLLRF